MDKVLSYLTLNKRQFHDLTMRSRVVLSQLPLSLTVVLIVVGGVLFHPGLFGSAPFMIGLALQAVLLVLCVVIPWDRLPYGITTQSTSSTACSARPIMNGALPNRPGWKRTPFMIGLALQAVLLVLCVVIPWDRLPYGSFLAIPLLDFIPIGLMRYGSESIITGVGLLTVFPVVWFAASGLFPRTLLSVSFLATLGIVWIPVFLTGIEVNSQSLTQSFLLPFIMLAIGATIRVMTASMMTQQRIVEEKDTELQRLLAESARRERLLETVVNSVDIGLIAVDETGATVLANRKLEQFRALAGGTADTREADLHIFQQDGETAMPAARRPTDRAVEGQIFSDYLQWWGRRPHQRVLSTSSRLMIDQDGTREGSVVTFNDVTELVAALNAKDDFVSTVSHELRTPLTAIRGYLELLVSMPDLDPEVASGLEVVSRNSERLHRLVVDLLSSAEASPEIAPDPMDLSELIGERVRVAAERNSNPLVHFENLSEPGLIAECDGPRIGQVFDNLLSNAVKYSPRGGRVTVRAAKVDGEIECSVSDQGIGMSAEELTGVFSKFFRTSAARNAAIPGVGLGLALSKGIVEKHGGTISCTSVEGEGSIFTFRLPAAHARPEQRVRQ